MIAAERRARAYPVWLPQGAPAREPKVRRRARLHPMAGATVVAVLLTLPLLLYVSQLAHRSEAGYSIRRLQSELHMLRAENARLVSLSLALKSPQRIEQYAQSELGMVPPRQRQLAAITVGPAVAQAQVPTERRGNRGLLTAFFGGNEAEARERSR